MPTFAQIVDAAMDIITETGVLVLAFVGIVFAVAAAFVSRLVRGGR